MTVRSVIRTFVQDTNKEILRNLVNRIETSYPILPPAVHFNCPIDTSLSIVHSSYWRQSEMSDEELVAEALAKLHEAGSKGGKGEEVKEVQEEQPDTLSPKKRGRKPKRPEPKFPVEPQVIQV
jgi:hypothetical protein